MLPKNMLPINHILKGATIKGKNILPIGSIILSFKNSPYENRW